MVGLLFMGTHVFISYSRKDQTYARKLADDLRKRGFEPWMDDRIDFGGRWWRTIDRKIRTCAAFVVVMTPDSEESEWVEREVQLALREGKPIFPLLLRGPGFSLLITKQHADVAGERLPPVDFYERLGQVASARRVPEPKPAPLARTAPHLTGPPVIEPEVVRPLEEHAMTEEREHLRNLREKSHKRLQVLELQVAELGELHAPPHKLTEIEQLRAQIADLDAKLAAEPPSPEPEAPSVQSEKEQTAGRPPFEPEMALPPLDYRITQKLPDGAQRRFPDVGFVITNLGDSLPVRVRVKVEAVLHDRTVVFDEGGYYSGSKFFNVNPRRSIWGHFTFPQEIISDEDRTELRITVSIIDQYEREHSLLPEGWVYMPDQNAWYAEP